MRPNNSISLATKPGIMLAALLVLAACNGNKTAGDAAGEHTNAQSTARGAASANATTETQAFGFILSGCPVRAAQFAGVAQLTSSTQVRVFFDGEAARAQIDYLDGTVTFDGDLSQEAKFRRSLNSRYLYAQLAYPVLPPATARVTLSSGGRRADITTVTFTEFTPSPDDAPPQTVPQGASKDETLASMRETVLKLEKATEQGDRNNYVPLVRILNQYAESLLAASSGEERVRLEPMVLGFRDALTSTIQSVDAGNDAGSAKVLDEVRDRLMPKLSNKP